MRRISLGIAITLLGGMIPALSMAQEEESSSESQAGGKSPKWCIAPQASKRVEECPEFIPKRTKKPRASPRSRLKEVKRKKEKAEDRPEGPSIEIDLATLRNKEKIQVRARKLLLREIAVTKRLIGNTRKSDPRRPDYLLRLTEGYFELVTQQNAAVRKLDEPIWEACTKQKNRRRCAALKRKQKQEAAKLKKLRQQNITALATLVKDHPDFKRMDEVLFSLGFALEEMKQHDEARRVYHRLIKGHPRSKFIPNAYLSFAEYYFQQGDMRAANQFYDKVVEIPPERNNVYGYALYKQAWCAYNLEDYKGSLQKFVDVIEFGTNNPDASNVKNLVQQARRELVMPYAQVGNPKRALEFFGRYAKDRPQAYELFESLGELYYDTGQWGATIAVYHGLMAERPDSPEVCYWQSRVSNAVISSQPKPKQVVEVRRMIDMWETYKDSSHPKKAKQQCKQHAASMLIDLATAWHRETIGTDTQPGTNDRRTMEQAAKLYRLTLDTFPDMEQMKFPEIDKRDWPTEYRVSYFYAELLWKMENWAQCGPAFDRVVELNPKGQFTADAAYASVLCYNKQYQSAYQASQTEVRGRGAEDKKRRGRKKKKEDLTAKFAEREFSPLEAGMLNAFQRYICFVPDSEDLPTIKYRRARIFYETNHFDEAALMFKDIAFNHSDSDLAVYAANLYLDSLNVLGTYRDPKRTQCFDDMNEQIEPMYDIYCKTPEQREENAELCTVVEQLRCDLLRKKAEGLHDNAQYRKAAGVYVSIFRRFRECGQLDEVLYNAAIEYEAARLLGRSIQVRKVLIDQYPESKYAKRGIYQLGANYHALAIYEQAAEYYEQFASKYPGEDGSECTEDEKADMRCPIAHEALQNAVFFRLGLGDEEKAEEDKRLFEKNYRRKYPRETSQVVYSVGSIYERQEDWPKVASHYRSFLRSYGRRAYPHEVIQANVKIGNAHLAMKNKRKAQPYFRAAEKAWRRGAPEKLAKADIPDDQKQRYLALAKVAAAEAIFHQADVAFDEFESIGFPKYRAPRTRNKEKKKEAFQKWMKKGFKDWMEKKRQALFKAKKEFERIAPLEVPPWDIAAAARIGDMWKSFVDNFRDAPVPPELKGDDELVDIYYQGLDEASKPWIEEAKNAYEFCLITATKVRWFNEHLTHCEEELFKLDPRKYPRAAELRGRSTYAHSVDAVPGAVRLGKEEETL